MSIALVLTPLNERNLQLAAQISVDEIVYYTMGGMSESMAELRDLRHRIEDAPPPQRG